MRTSARSPVQSAKARGRLVSLSPAAVRLIRAAVDDRYSGNVSAAARSLRGMPFQTLWGIYHGKRIAVREGTLRQLRELLPATEQEELDVALVSGVVAKLVRAHSFWVADQRWAIMVGQRYRYVGRHDGIEKVTDPYVHERGEEMDSLRRGLRKRRETAKLLGDFEDFARERGHDKLRIDLAVDRAIEPLLACRESAFIERDWRDLTRVELRRFLRHRLESEKILLRRASAERVAANLRDRMARDGFSSFKEPDWDQIQLP